MKIAYETMINDYGKDKLKNIAKYEKSKYYPVAHKWVHNASTTQKKYIIDCPFPAQFDAKAKRWLFEDGPCTWDDVMKRWKARGSMNEEFVGMVQRGKREMLRLLEQET